MRLKTKPAEGNVFECERFIYLEQINRSAVFHGKAKEYGCDQFILFAGTPPVYYTKNGKGWSSSGESANLKDDCYDDYADFLATVAQHFTDEGYNISLISPVNEPEFDWTGGQEGSGWRNSEVARIARELDAKLTEKGLSNTKMLLAEAQVVFPL